MLGFEAGLNRPQRHERPQTWANQRTADYNASLARAIGIPADAARLQFERSQTRWQTIDEQVVAGQQRTADFYQKVGQVKQRLDVRKTFDTGFPMTD